MESATSGRCRGDRSSSRRSVRKHATPRLPLRSRLSERTRTRKAACVYIPRTLKHRYCVESLNWYMRRVGITKQIVLLVETGLGPLLAKHDPMYNLEPPRCSVGEVDISFQRHAPREIETNGAYTQEQATYQRKAGTTNSVISLVPFPRFLSSFAAPFHTCQ